MPLYLTGENPAEAAQAYERSPVVGLITDGAPEAEIPAEVRGAADRVITSAVPLMRRESLPSGCDAAISWMAGDRLLAGTAASLRQAVFAKSEHIFFPVHLPCLPEIDLVGLQPRICLEADGPPLTETRIRVAAASAPSSAAAAALEDREEPWACLSRALLAEQNQAGAGIEALSKLWRDSAVLRPVDGGLVIRNLIVLEIKQNRLDPAERLLNVAMDFYPRYAELPLLAAWISIAQEKLRRAGRYVQQALENPDRLFVGGGGETSYRAQWLLGLVAELCGKQALALQGYGAAVAARPAFPPAVLGMLRQRLARRDAGNYSTWVLLTLVHREPQYLEPVFHFLVVHRQFAPARRLLQSSRISDELRQKLESRLDEAATVYKPRRTSQTVARPGVMLTGPFWVNSSLGTINRELAAALAGSGDFETALEPYGSADFPGTSLPHFETIARGFKQRLSRLDLTIRHHWPPDFGPAPCGRLVCIFPWEFGAIPRKWAEQIKQNVTAVWAPSQFVQSVLSAAGVDAGRVEVIPNGVDTSIFTPEGPAWRPEGCRSFVFLFVGGAIPRKGVDVLWKAYAQAFTSRDDATLIVKDLGSTSFYAAMSLLDSLRVAANHPTAPHLMTLTEEFDAAKLAALYRGCNVFVLPYRGEGFGMPLAEALACGKPVVATALGPAREFCPPEASWFIRAHMAEFQNPQSTFGPASGPMTWFEPDVNELAGVLRYTFEHQEDASRKGRSAAEKIAASLSWNRITQLQFARIRQLTCE